MALDADVFDTDLVNVIADLPATMVWNGETVSCAASPITRSSDFDNLAGIYFDTDVEAIVAVSAFADPDTVPQAGVDPETLTIDGETFRIKTSAISSCGKQIHLRLSRESG